MEKENTKNDKYYIESSCINLNKKDYLENYIYSDELCNKIENYFNSSITHPLYIGIVGAWGSGKTSVVETALSKQDKKTKIYKYDAWKYEDDSFRRNFIQDILSQSGLKQDNKVYKKIIESLYEDYSINFNSIIERMKLSEKKDTKINKKTIIILMIVAGVCFFGGIYEIFKNEFILGNILTVLGAMGIFNIFYSNTNYSKSKLFSSEQFYKSFVEIMNEVKETKNIILIDNLDRCDEDELKKTLSAIKGFYLEKDNSNQEKIIFIIPLDISSLKQAYKENEIYYLDKIFDDMIYIKDKYSTDKLDFINQILLEYSAINDLICPESKSIIINSTINTPREIIKTINDYVTEYNLLLSKTSEEFTKNSNNRNFLMKTIILKRKYYGFYQVAYNDIEKFIKIIENESPYEVMEEVIKDEELIYFLKINRSIKPTDYYDFFQNQGVKMYNKIPDNIKKAIMKQDIKTILDYKSKEQVITYYEHIYDDYINGFWEVNILNKYITLIELYKNNYFNEKETSQIISSWELLFDDDKFKKINIEKCNIIGYENELIFAKKIYKNIDFNIFILDCINGDKYDFDSEIDKYEKLSKWVLINNNIILDNKYSELINSYCDYIIENSLQENIKYLAVLFKKNIKIINTNIIKKIIFKISDNKIIIQLLNSLQCNQINESSLADEFINWLNTNKISDIKIILVILNYIIKNNKSITTINKLNIENFEETDNETISNIIKIYVENNVYNNAIFQMLKELKNKTTIKSIISGLINQIPEENDEYINHYIEYFFGLPIDIEKENLKSLIEVVNKYKNYEEEIIKKIINNGLLKKYYDSLTDPEDREHVIGLSLKLVSGDFEKQLENIFIYESSYDKIQILLENHNTIDEYVKVINSITKKSIKNKLLISFIEIIEEKDNILKSESESIELLNVDAEMKRKIKKILKKKEIKNKEIVEV